MTSYVLEGCNSNTDSSLRRTCKRSILARILAQCAHAFANEYSPIVRHATANPEAGAKRQAGRRSPLPYPRLCTFHFSLTASKTPSTFILQALLAETQGY